MDTWLFIISGIGTFAMLGVRMLEIKFERALVLAGISMRAERRMKPHVRRFSENWTEFKMKVRMQAAKIPAAAEARIGRLRQSWAEYAESLGESARGKRALSRGSVSFFLLNISDYKKWGKHAINDTPLAPEAVPVESAEAAEENI